MAIIGPVFSRSIVRDALERRRRMSQGWLAPPSGWSGSWGSAKCCPFSGIILLGDGETIITNFSSDRSGGNYKWKSYILKTPTRLAFRWYKGGCWNSWGRRYSLFEIVICAAKQRPGTSSHIFNIKNWRRKIPKCWSCFHLFHPVHWWSPLWAWQQTLLIAMDTYSCWIH